MQILGSQVCVIRFANLIFLIGFFLEIDAFMLGEVEFDRMTDVFKAVAIS